MTNVVAILAALLGASAVVYADMRRRRLALNRPVGWNIFTFVDLAAEALLCGFAAWTFVVLIPSAISDRAIRLDSPAVWRIAVAVGIFVYVWSEGQRQLQFQRPNGIVCGEALILVSTYLLAESFILAKAGATPRVTSAIGITVGAGIIGFSVKQHFQRSEAQRVVDRFVTQGEFVQPEYVAATEECPHPERWKMMDAKTVEVEVLDFLRSFIQTVKPSLVVETGTFLGYSALNLAAGLKANGFGKVITIENDPEIFAKANERFDASELRPFIENRHQSSLDAKVDGTIDLLFCDSWGPIREQEVRNFLPQIAPRGLILMHDSSRYFKDVYEAALRLEKEGLITLVFLPTPRGLLIAQKLEGRIV